MPVTVTIVRLYDDHAAAANAAEALQKEGGVPQADISVMTRGDRAAHAGRGAEIGAALGGIAGLLVGLGLFAMPGVGPVAATGWLAATLAGAAAGGWAGGALGVISEAGVSGEEAHAFAEGLRRGSTLVSARVPEAAKDRCEAILNRGAVDIRVRVAAYRAAGWSSHDAAAAPYSEDEIRRELEQNRGR
jgi:hypothetical protein